MDFFLTGNNVLLFLQDVQKAFHILLENALLFFLHKKSKLVEKRELGGNKAGQRFFKISLQYSTLQPGQREPPLSLRRLPEDEARAFQYPPLPQVSR